MWCKSLEVLNPYEALKEANMTDLKPCPFCKNEKIGIVLSRRRGRNHCNKMEPPCRRGGQA